MVQAWAPSANFDMSWGPKRGIGTSMSWAPSALRSKRPYQAIIVSVAGWPNQAIIALPETEAPHLGVSSGGVEVEGVFANFAGKHLGIEQPAA